MNQEVRDALETIVKVGTSGKTKALNYAVAYALAGLEMTGEELRVQCLYVLANTTHWRGEVAKQTKTALHEFTQAKG